MKAYFIWFIIGVDVDAATRHNIKVARIPGSATGNASSCAEMAIYLILGLLRKQVSHVQLIICKQFHYTFVKTFNGEAFNVWLTCKVIWVITYYIFNDKSHSTHIVL